jgi:hypothetical protein
MFDCSVVRSTSCFASASATRRSTCCASITAWSSPRSVAFAGNRSPSRYTSRCSIGISRRSFTATPLAGADANVTVPPGAVSWFVFSVTVKPLDWATPASVTFTQFLSVALNENGKAVVAAFPV